MLSSKVPCFLRNSAKKLQNDLSCASVLSRKLFSNATVSTEIPSTEKANPDKLYKKIEIEVRGNDPAVLKSYGEFSVMAANHLGINVARNMAPYKANHERYTLLKSVHVHKKHRVQYEIRTYYRFLDFTHMTGSTADTFVEYLQRNLPEGVAMKVTKVELQQLPPSITEASF